MRGKVLRFFPSPPSYIHGFPTQQTATSVSTKTSRSSGEFSLKLSLAYLEMDESTLLTRVCRFHAFQDDHAVTGGEELQWKWVQDETDLRTNASLLASSASCFLISWQKPSRFFATTVEYFLKYFKFFSWCQLSEEQKFSRENFRGLLKICENRERLSSSDSGQFLNLLETTFI